MPDRCRHECRVANQKRCGIAPGYESADISGALEIGIESSHYVVRRQYERSSRVRKSYEVMIAAEDLEAQFLLEFPDLPAHGRLRNVKAIRRLAECNSSPTAKTYRTLRSEGIALMTSPRYLEWLLNDGCNVTAQFAPLPT